MELPRGGRGMIDKEETDRGTRKNNWLSDMQKFEVKEHVAIRSLLPLPAISTTHQDLYPKRTGMPVSLSAPEYRRVPFFYPSMIHLEDIRWELNILLFFQNAQNNQHAILAYFLHMLKYLNQNEVDGFTLPAKF
jgi:hypothetical protein